MMKIETVSTPSFRMDFFRFGQGERRLVILPGLSVQSVTLFADGIRDAYAPLAKDFTVFVFDRRRELPPVYSVDDMAEDTAEAMAAAGIRRACLFGASQGGMMAMKIAARHPGLVEKLVIASAAERIPDESRPIFANWIGLAEKGEAEGLYFAFGEAIYPPALWESSRPLLAEAAKSVTREDLSRFVILAKAAKDFDGTEELESIACPALAVGDTDDRIFGGGAAQAIFRRMKNSPGAALYVYTGYGHAVYDAAPDFKERILRFLKSSSVSRRSIV